VVALDALLGPALALLHDDPAGAHGWAARFARLDAFLVRRLAAAPPATVTASTPRWRSWPPRAPGGASVCSEPTGGLGADQLRVSFL
jgi:hypothetical protein